jgi:hypothetical protein
MTNEDILRGKFVTYNKLTDRRDTVDVTEPLPEPLQRHSPV